MTPSIVLPALSAQNSWAARRGPVPAPDPSPPRPYVAARRAKRIARHRRSAPYRCESRRGCELRRVESRWRLRESAQSPPPDQAEKEFGVMLRATRGVLRDV